jgi:hypothetical protein
MSIVVMKTVIKQGQLALKCLKLNCPLLRKEMAQVLGLCTYLSTY